MSIEILEKLTYNRKYSKRNFYFPCKPIFFLLLLFCLLAYCFPEQTHGILGQLGRIYPEIWELPGLSGFQKEQVTSGSANFEIHMFGLEVILPLKSGW